MATQKVSLTLDRALQLRLQHDRILTLLKELDAEYGPVDEQTTAEVRREWQDANASVVKRRRKG